MGKGNKRKNRHKKKSEPSPERKKEKSAHSPTRTTATRSASLPLQFPSNLKVPKDSFLRNQEPYKQSFEAALKTSYEGFVVDEPAALSENKEQVVQSALLDLEKQGFFRTDVTQPFGLGTKCAKTYVTRCLLGDKGTTYKYLGLRMFSQPWTDDTNDAVGVIHDLNRELTTRTIHHLSELNKIRNERGETMQGRAGFDVCLINRMEHSPDLKQEPSLGQGKCAVSWHADSSLEHYSTIAVYQTILNDDKNDSDTNEWSVALRVAHNAEGPESSRRGTDIQSTLVADTPTLSVSLPSGSAYYLLDDFNHHHQHAVVSEGSSSNSVRYSSTHRLLRHSHNVAHILERCQRTCSLFHKKGSKIWRPEQLLLTEIESEWIRQFYIQGQQHYDLLWAHWGDSMQQLLRYWSQLEARTKQTIDFLQLAAEARCGIDTDTSKTGRKKREKRKKALDTFEELVSRIGTARTTAIQSLYEPLAELLRERAEMRRLWKKREDDHVFRELDRSQRPLAVPFDFNVDTKTSGDNITAVSPLREDLLETADRVVAFGRACVACNANYLPLDVRSAQPTKRTDSTTKPTSDEKSHFQPLDWSGWSDRQVGLEMQSPWAGLLLQGRKTIETRTYELPPALLGKRIEILQSKQGSTVSALGNVVPITNADPVVERVGWCKFTQIVKYVDRALFDADQDAHWVTNESDFYPFKNGSKVKVIYGWVVGEVGLAADEVSRSPLKSIERRYRSLFELQYEDNSKVSRASNKRKKRRRF